MFSMMKLKNINIRSYLSPQIIIENGCSYFATSNILPLNHNFNNEGITILPTFENIPNTGQLSISQFAVNHILSVTLETGKTKTFASNGLRYKDTNGASDTFYKIYPIKGNNFYSDNLYCEIVEPIFNDAPYRELFVSWISFSYKVEFETWFLFSNENSILPLGKFNWKVDCKMVISNNKWVIVENNSSSEVTTKNSLQIIENSNDIYIPTINDKQLFQVAETFFNTI